VLGYRGKLFIGIISTLLRLFAYKIWGMQFKGNIFKFGVEWIEGGRKK